MKKTKTSDDTGDATTEAAEDTAKPTKGPSPEQVAAKKEADKRARAISVAGAKGEALSTRYQETAESALQRILGDKVVVSEKGLVIANGVTVSENDAASLIGTILGADKKEKHVRSTIQRSIGDLVIAVKGAFGDEVGDQLIQQVASERGQTKHTTQECERTMRWVNDIWEFDDRPKGLYFSHLLDGKNYTRTRDGVFLVPKDRIKEIFELASLGEVVASGTKADGTTFEVREPWSTAKLREALVAERPDGEKPKPKPAAGPPAESGDGSGHQSGDYVAPKGFFYIKDDANVYWDEELNMDALALKEDDGETDVYTIVLDVENMCLLRRNGKKLSTITQLPEVVAQEEEAELAAMP